MAVVALLPMTMVVQHTTLAVYVQFPGTTSRIVSTHSAKLMQYVSYTWHTELANSAAKTHSSFWAASWASLRSMPATPAP